MVNQGLGCQLLMRVLSTNMFNVFNNVGTEGPQLKACMQNAVEYSILGFSESGGQHRLIVFVVADFMAGTMLSRTRTTLWLCGSCFSLRFGVRTSHWHVLAFPNGFA